MRPSCSSRPNGSSARARCDSTRSDVRCHRGGRVHRGPECRGAGHPRVTRTPPAFSVRSGAVHRGRRGPRRRRGARGLCQDRQCRAIRPRSDLGGRRCRPARRRDVGHRRTSPVGHGGRAHGGGSLGDPDAAVPGIPRAARLGRHRAAATRRRAASTQLPTPARVRHQRRARPVVRLHVADAGSLRTAARAVGDWRDHSRLPPRSTRSPR